MIYHTPHNRALTLSVISQCLFWFIDRRLEFEIHIMDENEEPIQLMLWPDLRRLSSLTFDFQTQGFSCYIFSIYTNTMDESFMHHTLELDKQNRVHAIRLPFLFSSRFIVIIISETEAMWSWVPIKNTSHFISSTYAVCVCITVPTGKKVMAINDGVIRKLGQRNPLKPCLHRPAPVIATYTHKHIHAIYKIAKEIFLAQKERMIFGKGFTSSRDAQ